MTEAQAIELLAEIKALRGLVEALERRVAERMSKIESRQDVGDRRTDSLSMRDRPPSPMR